MRKIIFLLIMFLIIGAAGFFGYRIRAKKPAENNTRQAVFLSNGQVYFGFVSKPEGQIVTLARIYYLKTEELNSPENKDNTVETNDKNRIVLVKFGGELHGPEDQMFINRDQILFIENMRENSKINEMIKKMEE